MIATMAIKVKTATRVSCGDGLSIRYGRSAGYFLSGIRSVTSTPNKRRMAYRKTTKAATPMITLANGSPFRSVPISNARTAVANAT